MKITVGYLAIADGPSEIFVSTIIFTHILVKATLKRKTFLSVILDNRNHYKWEKLMTKNSDQDSRNKKLLNMRTSKIYSLLLNHRKQINSDFKA